MPPKAAPQNSGDVHLTLKDARALQLAAMDLLTPPKRTAKKADVLAAIRRMNVLQIDTIHIVARSPYLVLWSRLGEYPPRWLDELLTEGALFEYWSHAACFLPIEDYPQYRRQMLHLEAAGSERSALRLAADPHAHLELVEHGREHGPVRATDFDHVDGRKGNGWWDWKPDKLRLETLFTAGEIMVKRRENFHRVYDVRERVLPPHFLDDEAVPSRDAVEFAWTLANALKAAQNGKLRPTRCSLLSPFDPLVWDRERVLKMFNFDYRIECYTPEAKRKYGYFTLPILVRGELVGRVDTKAHRADKLFEVRALHLEDGVTATESLAADIAGAVNRCALWHQTPTVRVSRTAPAKFWPMLQKALAAC